MDPVQPVLQEHVFGAVHTPPFWHRGEQMAAERNGQYHISSCQVNLDKDDTHLESKHDLSIPYHNCSGWEKCTDHFDRLVSR